MNHQQIREELSKAEQAVEQLKKLLNEPQGFWKPVSGEKYYYWNPHLAEVQSFTFDNHRLNKPYEYGQAFRTKEEAEREGKRLKVIQKLRELAGGFKPDWDDKAKNKWFLVAESFERVPKWTTVGWSFFVTGVTVYFETKDKAEAAITTLGDELNVLLEQ